MDPHLWRASWAAPAAGAASWGSDVGCGASGPTTPRFLAGRRAMPQSREGARGDSLTQSGTSVEVEFSLAQSGTSVEGACSAYPDG